MLIGFKQDIKIGEAKSFNTPLGENYLLVRKSEADFVAYSSRCPHLGCRVHWEKEKNRFYCPCHAGIFDQNGIAIAGPPAKAKQRLSHMPLETQNQVIYGILKS